MKSRYLTIFLFLIGCLSGFAQSHAVDSLKGVLNTEQEDTNKVNTLNKLCEVLWRIGSYNGSMVNASLALELEEKIISSPDSILVKAGENGMARTYKAMGVIYRHLGNYSKALEYDLKALH